MENIVLSSMPIELSDFPNHKEAIFLISVLDEYNLNNVLIEKSEGEKYHKTIIGYPIVAYLKYDANGKPDDFGGHELRAKYNKETKQIEYYFATYPIGSVIDAWIEEREVDGYKGLKSVVLIKTKLWKSRLPEYFKVFDKLWESGKISSSWEISVIESKKTKKGKVLKAFEFIGNCLLGSTVDPAVPGAGVLEVASNDEINYELSKAFAEDIKVLKADQNMSNSEIDDESVINTDDIENNEGGTDMNKPIDVQSNLASMTDNDLYNKIRKAINANSDNTNKWYYIARVYPYEYRVIAYEWDRQSDDDYVEFSYSVLSNEEISINSQKEVKMVFIPKETYDAEKAEYEEKINKLDKDFKEASEAVVELTSQKEELNKQIEEFSEYKAKFEEIQRAEQEKELAKKQEELKAFALENELIASAELDENEDIKKIFAELSLENYEESKEKIKYIKYERAFNKLQASKNNQKIETSEKSNKQVNVRAAISDDTNINPALIMSTWVNSKY